MNRPPYDLIEYYPTITRDGMIEVDRIMVNELGVPIQIMMEQAGLNLARISVKYAKLKKCDRYLVVSGGGNNGGGGLVAARRLYSWGYNVTVVLAQGEPIRKIPLVQYERAKRMGIRVLNSLDIITDPGTLVIDAFIGYNYQYRADSITDSVFDFLKESNVVALDIGSGIDSTTGQNISELSPIATATIAWPKRAFRYLTPDALGDLYLIDIGVPSDLYLRENILDNAILSNQLDLLSNLFAQESVIPIKVGLDGWKFD